MSSAGQEFGLVVLGAGRAGMVHAHNLRIEATGARLAGIIDADAEVAARSRRELELDDGHTSLDDALQDPTVRGVVITTPTYTHEELALRSFEAGKHVLCEKPMALTVASADNMIRASREAASLLQMGFMRRFDPAFLDAREKLEAGDIGEIMSVRSVTRGPGLPPEWACDPKRGGGMLAEVNSHDFDTVRWLSASEYTRVYAESAVHKAHELEARWDGFYDTAVVTARMKNDALAIIDGACPADYGYDARVEVLGSRGVLFIGELKQQAVAVCTKQTGVTQRNFPSWRARFREAYVAELRHFVSCIREQREPAVSGADGREALRGVLAARESLRTGRAVELASEQEG